MVGIVRYPAPAASSALQRIGGDEAGIPEIPANDVGGGHVRHALARPIEHHHATQTVQHHDQR
jgi:hypothetical protein